jgi:cytochrome c peroxidase
VRKSLFTILSLVAFIVFLAYMIGGCKKDPIRGLQALAQPIPEGFPPLQHNFSDNPLTKEGFELGRKLFYDDRLSIDNMHSCASCHNQKAAFGTYQHDLSHGVNNTHTLRNAPVLFNLAWNKSFHWDGEFSSLEDEAVHPINGQNEMGETFNGILEKLKKDPIYPDMFSHVFKSIIIRPEFVLKALAQFTGSLTSADSKYDKYKKGQAVYTVQEENGYQVFKVKCATCHPEPLFTDFSYRNIGLPIDPLLNDYGRMRITGKKEDSLKFKVPTLRNTYISENYMHDGRFGTLSQCVNHYRTGIQQSSTLDPLLTGGIVLTNTEAADIVVFLRTLTDSAFISNPLFAKPQ